MQFTFAAVLSALALAGSAAAQVDQSAPFKLQITSDNTTTNGSFLVSCHEGAGIESLCLFGTAADASTFNLNTTQGVESNVQGDTPAGTLTWYLPSEPEGESEGAGFFVQPSTNVVSLIFGLGQTVGISFDSDNEMNIQSAYNDAVTPPTDDTSTVALYRWHLCETNFEGYQYTTLNWVLGTSSPTNPSCEPVTVTRIFS